MLKYTVIPVAVKDIQEELSHFADEGWELVQILPQVDPDSTKPYILIFKQPK